MQTPKPKQASVLDVMGSLNIKWDIRANVTTPIPNPINREGHIAPSYANTKFFTEYINSNEIGIPRHAIRNVLFLNHSNFICPCNWRNVSIWANKPNIKPLIIYIIWI